MSVSMEGAKQSPRIEDDTLKWYEGDTFSFNLTVTMKKSDGTVFEWWKDGGKMLVSFFSYEDRDTPVFSQEYTSTNGTITISIGLDETAKFPSGSYTYCTKFVRYSGTTVTQRKTVGAMKKAVVEKCH